MDVIAGALRQPRAYLRMLVRRVVVHDQVNVQVRRDARVQAFQKRQELPVSVTRLAFGKYGVRGDVEGGE